MLLSIEASLGSIVAHLARLRLPSARLLQPGLSRKAIAKVEETLPFKLTPELVTLYRVANGTRVNGRPRLDEVELFPGYSLLSLEDAVRERKRRAGSSQWKKSWFPVFANNAGDYYVVSCGAGPRRVVGFLRGEPEQLVEYASLRAMFATIAECFAKGAFFVKKRETIRSTPRSTSRSGRS